MYSVLYIVCMLCIRYTYGSICMIVYVLYTVHCIVYDSRERYYKHKYTHIYIMYMLYNTYKLYYVMCMHCVHIYYTYNSYFAILLVVYNNTCTYIHVYIDPTQSVTFTRTTTSLLYTHGIKRIFYR